MTDMEISDSEKRRARNQVWTAAEVYGFDPELKAYDEDGKADLYWNCIIGTVRRDYDREKLNRFFATFRGSVDEQLYEQLVWLGLENAAFMREAGKRPALPALRRQYARRILALTEAASSDRPIHIFTAARCREILGLPAELKDRDGKILSALDFSGDWDTRELTDRAAEVLRTYFGYVPISGAEETPGQQKPRRRGLWLVKKQAGAHVDLPAVRGFGFGVGEHLAGYGGKETGHAGVFRLPSITSQEPDKLRKYVEDYFGPALYDRHKSDRIERDLCAGSHEACHLYLANGSNQMDHTIRGYAGDQRRLALKQMERNREFYQANLVRNRTSITRLTARIQNAMLAHLEPVVTRTAAGTLNAARVWRSLYLDDDKVFTRVLRGDPGDLSVDLLLDASTSQIDRQETVSSQGYMIAESLTRCNIPVRVCSFCSLSGFTVLTQLRGYDERKKNENIFHYFTTGCNRDGLGLRAAKFLLEESRCEHKMLIVLSDAKPYDVQKIPEKGGAAWQDYAESAAVSNTAREVRAIMRTGVSVICVFTGDDEDLPAARTIYGRNFTRIRNLDQFADTVGSLIQNQIRNL